MPGVSDPTERPCPWSRAAPNSPISLPLDRPGVKLSPEFLESCYTPIIQSGGKFDLKPSAFSNAESLFYGTITCSLGARYKSYCSNVGRTYIINPSKSQEKHYKLLLELQQAAIDAMRPDAKLSAVYAAVQNRLKSKAPALEGNLTKNVGFATGLEFREYATTTAPRRLLLQPDPSMPRPWHGRSDARSDPAVLCLRLRLRRTCHSQTAPTHPNRSAFQLNAKSEVPLRAGMVFNLAVGLDGLENADATDVRCSPVSPVLFPWRGSDSPRTLTPCGRVPSSIHVSGARPQVRALSRRHAARQGGGYGRGPDRPRAKGVGRHLVRRSTRPLTPHWRSIHLPSNGRAEQSHPPRRRVLRRLQPTRLLPPLAAHASLLRPARAPLEPTRYYLKDDDDDEAASSKEKKGGSSSRGNVEILESRTRGAGKQHEAQAEATEERDHHQVMSPPCACATRDRFRMHALVLPSSDHPCTTLTPLCDAHPSPSG